MDISLATRKMPRKTHAPVEKPCLEPYQGTSTAAAKKVNENRRILVQMRGAPAAGGDAELGAVGLGGMAVGGSPGWPVKPVKHSTVPAPKGKGGGVWEAAHERLVRGTVPQGHWRGPPVRSRPPAASRSSLPHAATSSPTQRRGHVKPDPATRRRRARPRDAATLKLGPAVPIACAC